MVQVVDIGESAIFTQHIQWLKLKSLEVSLISFQASFSVLGGRLASAFRPTKETTTYMTGTHTLWNTGVSIVYVDCQFSCSVIASLTH